MDSCELHAEWREIRQKLGNLVSKIDGQTEKLNAENARLEVNRHEEYLRGLSDMAEAVNAFAGSAEKSMSFEDMKRYYGTVGLVNALENTAPKEFVDKYQQWKAELEEFRIGDEIDYTYPSSSEPIRCVVIAVDGDIVWATDLKLHGRFWFYKEDTRRDGKIEKTGGHYDYIPFPDIKEEF